MNDIIPSWYGSTRMVGAQGADDEAFGNLALRAGQVMRVVEPEDVRSLSKRYREYDVLVDHRHNGVLAGKMYHGCLLLNTFGGVADHTDWTLRADLQGQQGGRDAQEPGFGSKVLVLCVNGEHSSAWIVGGVKDQRQDERGTSSLGHHLEWEFNGAHLAVRDDGSWQLENRGKTSADGTADPKRDKDGAGTKLTCEANGNFVVETARGQFIRIDHKAGTVEVSGEKKLTLVADRVNLGSDADEHAVLGDQLKAVMERMIDLVLKPDAYATAVGPTLGAIHSAEWLKLRSDLSKVLSHQTYLKKTAR